MSTITEKSLIDALSYCDLRELPQEDTKEYVWLKALALASKMDGTKSYILIDKDVDGGYKIKKDFGSVSAIKSVDKIYPFAMLDASYMPAFKTKTKEERIEWLKKNDYEGEITSDITLKGLDKLVLNVVTQTALRSENNR